MKEEIKVFSTEQLKHCRSRICGMLLKGHVRDILRLKIPVIFRKEKCSQINELKFHLKKQVSGSFFL